MVNNRRNVGKWDDAPPPDEGADQKIAGGPLYSPDELEPLLLGGHLLLWTRKCIADAAKLDLDEVAAGALIWEAVTEGRYHCSEWCGQKPGGPVAACDAYVLYRKEWNEAARRDLDCEYFVKFAIGKTGKVVLTISCHTSR